MDAVGQLSPQDWLDHSDTQTVMKALMADGAVARFAGGCVRDAVLGVPVHDIDVAITCTPEKSMALLKSAGIRVIPTGIDHGTVTAVMPTYTYEITTLRKDEDTDGRHAVVSYTTDWEMDAARRDLTINALYADVNGAVYDPGTGLSDLGERRIRFVGNPEDRVQEDVLRILRYFRFYGRFGNGHPSRRALAACRKYASRLQKLSGERIRSEMLRILEGRDPSSVILLMQGEKITPWLFPMPIVPGRLRMLAWLESRGIVADGVEVCALRRLAALVACGDEAKDLEAVVQLTKMWKLSQAEAKRLKLALSLPKDLPKLSPDMTRGDARRVLYALGEKRYRDHALLAWANYRHDYGVLGPVPGSRGTRAWSAILRLPITHPTPVFPLSGQDVLECGLAPGPQIGEILRTLETQWIAEGFVGDREALLMRLTGTLVE